MARVIMSGTESLKLLKLKPILMSATAAKHTASVIFLHGSGDTGEGIQSWLHSALGSEFAFPHIRVIYPTAPVRPYTPMNGMPSTVWFDRQQISPYCDEDLASINDMCECINDLVVKEGSCGVSEDRIIVGGFSMGGSLALHYGYRFCTDLAGVFALSCFLNENSIVFDAIKDHDGVLPPLYQAHGSKDPLVDPRWGGMTHKALKQLGISSQYHVYPNLLHEVGHTEIASLYNWILSRLPPEKAVAGN
jgi:phospholipase/carboxylesterase